MSKIFRLYQGGNNTYQDWNPSPAFPYNTTARATIEDPDGASARHEITSIPSPFARIDLIKAAFRAVCQPQGPNRVVDLDGNTIFHKMVSDTLDVAEIFFNIDKYAGKVEVIKWDPAAGLAELEQSGIAGHLYMADALRKYMSSDAATYNFGMMRNIYLLNYVHGPNELNIIGATSPATLFFSNANDLSYVDDIFFGEDRPFDADYQPLYRRDFEFVHYLFALRNAIPNFAGLFPEVDDYLSATYTRIADPDSKEKLRSASANLFASLEAISVADVQQNDLVEVLGNTLYKKRAGEANLASDFTIAPTVEAPLRPLVLPVEAGNRYSALQYTTGRWGASNYAPFADKQADLQQRVLPFDGGISPYLTISDFLEDTVVRVPHVLNKESYFDGNIRINGQEFSYLLPVKPLLFEYFTADGLRGAVKDGRPMLEMTALAGDSGVKATLRIPIKGAGNVSYVEYSRIYYNNRSADIAKNEGSIVELRFTGFVMPQVRFANPADAVYNISLVQHSSGRNEMRFYQGASRLLPKSTTCRNVGQKINVRADNYLLEGANFDYIQVSSGAGVCGVVLPIFKQQQSTEQFEFAVDLGTSNTHIEYRCGGGDPQVFTVGARDRQLCEMFLPVRNEAGEIEDLAIETNIIEKDFIPGEIGGKDYKFPTRTVLSCADAVDWTNVVDPFTMVNLPFTYDKRNELAYNKFKDNIKWGGGEELRVMESYVRCLMLIIRNKVLLNNGDLRRTKITWFYPISMSPNRLQRLRTTWNAAYARYFGNGATTCMTESAAPIQYFFRKYATATNLVNVDIGGGTTDIAFAQNQKVSHVTSFRFASNVLFEDSYAPLDRNNGIIDWHKGHFRKLFEERRELSELLSIFNSTSNARPANMASFLFGLKDNTIPEKAHIDEKSIDFNYLLQEDEKFKVVFVLFYTAIVYHIARIVKALGLEVPRHISFSGNGSKVLRIITTDPGLLSSYTKLIFERVLGRPYGKELDILGLERDSNPKESTCKGGIIGGGNVVNNDCSIVFKSDGSGVVGSDDTYNAVTDDYKRRAVEAVRAFFAFALDDMNKAFNFHTNFGVDPSMINVAKATAEKDLDIYLDKGIEERLKEANATDPIQETFFFYPIKGAIDAISKDIYAALTSGNQQSRIDK